LIWILTALLILLAFMGIGGVVLRVFGKYSFFLIDDDQSPDAQLMWMLALLAALGMGVGGNLILLTGFIRLPSSPLAWGITLLLAGYGFYFLYNNRSRFIIPLKYFSFKNLKTYYYLTFFAAFSLGLVLLTWMTLNVEVDVDGVAYHLSVPRAYINEGYIFSCVFEPHANINCLSDLSYLWAFLLQPDSVITPKLMELLRCLFTAFGVYGVASYLYNRPVAATTATLVFLLEEFARYGPTSHIDAGQSLYAIVSVGLLAKWLENPEKKHYLFLGALTAGFLVAVKQVGFILMGCILFSSLMLYIKYIIQKHQSVFTRKNTGIVVATGLVALLGCILFLFKNYLFTGTPFFPFLTSYLPVNDEAALGYIHLLNYYPPTSLAEKIPSLTHLHIVISNVRITNVNGILILSPLAALFYLLGKGKDSGNTRQNQRIMIILATVFILPVFLLAPFWRFLIAAYPLAMMVAFGELNLWLKTKNRPIISPIIGLGLVVYFSYSHLDFCRYSQFGKKNLTTNPTYPILTQKMQENCYRQYYPEKEVIDYVNQTLKPSDRLVAAINNQAIPLLEVRFISNVPCISQEAVTTMEMHGMDAIQMAQIFQKYQVTHYLTKEELNSGAALIFRNDHLKPIKEWTFDNKITVLYRFEMPDEK
jgi:hypothetical protein